MTDAANGEQNALIPRSVGERLRSAREKQKLALAEIAARTRVPLRHLEAIENGSYDSLPSPTYAVGFVRAYARTVGEDEVSLARDTREEVARIGRPVAQYQPYEIADPARVPSRGVVIVAAGVALAVVVLAVLWFAVGMWRNSGSAESASVASAPAVVAPVPTATPAAAQNPASGHVTLTATDAVWLRVYDADDKTLYLGTMKAGDKFDVPADAKDPKINVGRPDKLTVTLNGSALPPLGDGSRPIKGIAVSAAALSARVSGTPAAAPAAGATTPSGAAAAPTSTPARPAAFTDPKPAAPAPAANSAAPAGTPPGQ
ncbi:helix-turn-helix domain-containing protein [Sphingomonas lycopersici]|uniref:Helix-turn-helix domain-containing protein n=1 Tax=Sphingomonas lycopersici TaxID=2951807 RepID=A0AA42CPU8_9SPHN|nr:helix-turn-helix domain-containing protein [Sphingomonas lycopersici]MCW6534679.1 helix-turn-helix domain-containing protein [Sphingomonas lycopersici]